MWRTPHRRRLAYSLAVPTYGWNLEKQAAAVPAASQPHRAARHAGRHRDGTVRRAALMLRSTYFPDASRGHSPGGLLSSCALDGPFRRAMNRSADRPGGLPTAARFRVVRSSTDEFADI